MGVEGEGDVPKHDGQVEEEGEDKEEGGGVGEDSDGSL